MKITAIKQAVSKESLFATLSRWCQKGAGKKTYRIKMLSAFVSGKGVEAISPLVDIFLADGNELRIIFGTDRQGTDQEAVKRLYELEKAHLNQIAIKHFQAPAHASIFHPKLYILEEDTSISVVIGSANLTTGGLGSNLESLLLLENVGKSSIVAKEIFAIWDIFANPTSPLKEEFLNALTQEHLKKLINALPRSTRQEPKGSGKRVADLWKPLSVIQLPRSGGLLPRKKLSPLRAGQRYLIMDVLTETRKTQMQIPLDVIEGFFGIKRDQRHNISLSIWTADGPTQPIDRPIVMSSGNDGRRLMRRLEMPAIKELQRPLTVVFLKLKKKNHFAFSLFLKGTKGCKKISELLTEYGQQGGAVRRYIIGSTDDDLWKQASKLLGNG